MSTLPQDICSYLLRYAGELTSNPEAAKALQQFVMGLAEGNGSQQPIQNQTNTDCQQFHGPITGCVFAMPGATVYQQLPPPSPESQPEAKPKSKNKGKVKSSTRHPKSTEGFVPILDTFTRKRGLTDQHFALLFRTLQQEGWITEESDVDQFLDLFSGRPSGCHTIWDSHVGKGILRDLFKMMTDGGFIAPPTGHQYLRIVESHFIYDNGQPVTGLKGGYSSQKAKTTIASCRNILLLNPRAKDYRGLKSEIDDEFSDIRYTPYD